MIYKKKKRESVESFPEFFLMKIITNSFTAITMHSLMHIVNH